MATLALLHQQFSLILAPPMFRMLSIVLNNSMNPACKFNCLYYKLSFSDMGFAPGSSDLTGDVLGFVQHPSYINNNMTVRLILF